MLEFLVHVVAELLGDVVLAALATFEGRVALLALGLLAVTGLAILFLVIGGAPASP